ncbi:MAG: hypothetical protein QOF60_4 [Actinomycetota bacterium]|jgi:hypothetical protein|nr:hypothetical protein [Actinomycetota bacterium]
MALDERILAEVEQARLALESLEDQAYDARAGLHQAIRRLHAAGGSMREIATALGMSHQRVHQIIGADGIVEVESLPVPVTSTTESDACSFCGAPRRELDKLLAAPGHVFVCSGCVAVAAMVVGGGEAANMHTVPVEDDATCSFCGNPSSVGGAMAEAGKGSPRMCARCVSTCQRLLAPEREGKTMTRRSSKVRCSFCNVSQVDTKKLVAGPGVYVCEQCIEVGEDVVRTGDPVKGPRQVVLRSAITEDHACGFCAKPPAQVKGMVKGGRGRICNECLDLCQAILDEG